MSASSSISSSTETQGICYLVGAGPGDPGLLTLRAKECIEIADVLLYDYLSNPDFLRYAKPDAEKIYVGKKAKDHTLTQDEINALIVAKAKEGKIVTRLKGGDPVLFGRGAEEARELHDAGIAFEIVPGITSAIAGPIYAGIPVTHRSHCSQLTIFTGHEDPTKPESSLDYAKIAQADGTKVMLMGVERIAEISGKLIEHGADPSTPVALTRWATTGRQQTIEGNLSTIAKIIADTGFKAPAVCVIGSVVLERDTLNWFEKRPLFGKRIVVTRTRQQAGDLSHRLSSLGADVLELPTIRIEPPKDLNAFGQLVMDCHTYDWLVFTSPNGVEKFFDMFYKLYKDARAIGGVKIAAIGPGTAEKIRSYRFDTDLIPAKIVAEGLVAAFKKINVENQTMLWVKAEQTREVLGNELTGLRAIVDEAIAYRTVPESADSDAVQRFKEQAPDIITFTSSSTVEHFLKLNLPLAETTRIASIGPITSKTLRDNGLRIDIEAKEHSIPGLVKAIQEQA
ncbi:uroporphyrinogen-III C-methyltransferase [Phragmitibacter flavus]|uniref:uroporphyrinogen-III C-methyltransferase n=1 Tax=Phragmitibacter flavus TaxID=2576071 RepID=A0A5R8KDM6_9BACT|nr:uroporphyrinogen-III C-methyltransferase [Phragmitibacter flavus]TLD70406.1 uroporphyrinogen-III C-methyltransferase [Phragmitibacter flavus]